MADDRDDRPLVAVTRQPLPGEGIARLAGRARLRAWSEARDPEEADLERLVAGAAALVAIGSDPVTARVLDADPELRLVALVSAGYDLVDVGAARARGVHVSNTPDLTTESTAEFTVALALAARRRLVEGVRHLAGGAWRGLDMNLLLGLDLAGGRWGVIGHGRIGSAVARRAQALGMTVVHHSRTRHDDQHARWVPLDELLASSDVVSLHVPGGTATSGLLGEAELRGMRPTATLVNTARGPVVDEAALVRALREGWIHSAGLDVFAHEPLADPGHPLLHLDNCVATPHIAAATARTRSGMVDLAVENVLAVLDGHPPVTPV